MDINRYMELLDRAEKLKNNTRHSWTSSGRHESIAEHSWRLAFMAYFMKDEFPDVDINKVILMCMMHDFGEAFTGDIPAFDKTSDDENTEENVIKEYEAVDDGMSAYGKLQNDLKATQAAQEVTDQAVQELILATMKMGV